MAKSPAKRSKKAEIEKPPSPSTVNEDAAQEEVLKKSSIKRPKQDIISQTSSIISIDTGTTGSSTGLGSLGEEDGPTPGQRLMKQKHMLSLSIVAGVIFGYGLGFFLKQSRPKNYWTERRRLRVGFPGELFSNFLTSIRDPITFTSIIAAMGSIDKKICRFITLRSMLYVFTMNTVAASLGVLFTLPLAYNLPYLSSHSSQHHEHFCRPPRTNFTNGTITNTTHNAAHAGHDHGHCIDTEEHISNDEDSRCDEGTDIMLNLLGAHLPRNLVEAFLRESKRIPDLMSPSNARYKKYQNCDEFQDDHNTTNIRDLTQYDIRRIWSKSPNLAGIWFISFAIGICVIAVGEPAQSFLNLLISFSEIFLTMGTWALYLAPVGICFFTMERTLSNESILSLDTSMYWFILTYIVTTSFYTFLVMPLVYWLFTKKNPIQFFLAISPTMITAFGTATSYSTIPISITTLEEVAHLDPRVVRGLIPSLANGSFSGVTIFVSSSIVYLALKHSVQLSTIDYLSIIGMSSLSTIGTPRPITQLISSTIVIVLSSLFLDSEVAGDMLSSFWFLDAFSTLTDVTSNCVCAAVINSLSRRSLKALTLADEKKMAKAEGAKVNQTWDELFEQTTETITAPELPQQFISAPNY